MTLMTSSMACGSESASPPCLVDDSRIEEAFGERVDDIVVERDAPTFVTVFEDGETEITTVPAEHPNVHCTWTLSGGGGVEVTVSEHPDERSAVGAVRSTINEESVLAPTSTEVLGRPASVGPLAVSVAVGARVVTLVTHSGATVAEGDAGRGFVEDLVQAAR